MAWTTPRTWVTGELVTAAILNTYVRDNQDALDDGRMSIASQAAGDVFYATDANTVARLAKDAGKYLQSGASAPSWETITATTFASISPLTTRGDTLVATSGTVTGTRLAVGSAGQYVRSDGTDVSWSEGAKVIQVVSENLTSDNAYNGLLQNEVIDLSITPSNSANKILVYFSMCFNISGDSNSPYPEAFVTLWRGDKSGTCLQAQTVSGGYDAHNTIYIISSGSIIYLDSPSTTSAQEYTITTANRQHTSSTYRGRIYMYGDGTPGGQPAGTDLPFVYKNACALTLAELDFS
jgi:hypothetical protein